MKRTLGLIVTRTKLFGKTNIFIDNTGFILIYSNVCLISCTQYSNFSQHNFNVETFTNKCNVFSSLINGDNNKVCVELIRVFNKAKEIKFVVLRAEHWKNMSRLVGITKIIISEFRVGKVQKNNFSYFMWI